MVYLSLKNLLVPLIFIISQYETGAKPAKPFYICKKFFKDPVIAH